MENETPPNTPCHTLKPYQMRKMVEETMDEKWKRASKVLLTNINISPLLYKLVKKAFYAGVANTLTSIDMAAIVINDEEQCVSKLRTWTEETNRTLDQLMKS